VTIPICLKKPAEKQIQNEKPLQEKPKNNKRRIKKLWKKKHRVNKELKKLIKAYNNGVLPKGGYERTKTELEKEIKNIEDMLNNAN